MKRPPTFPAAQRNQFLNFELLFNRSAGGIQISGDSGTGKSCVMGLMMQQLAADPYGPGFALIDPHGDLAADMEEFCASLPEGRRRKVVVVHPSDLSQIAGLQPLWVNPEGLDELTWRTRVIKKAGHVARFLLYTWGERDFNSKPVLFKFTTWFLETLALAGLTLPDVRHFFDPDSPIYGPLAQLAPDPIARLELLELADMRFVDREDLISSTKNRFLGLLKSPPVELSFGKLGAFLDAQRLIQDGAIVLINLEPAGILRDEDREILANAWLGEFIFGAMNTPRSQRRQFGIFIDELPVFAASANLLWESVTQTRKFMLHFCCAHAGTQFFADGVQDKLLNGLTSACRVHVLFRHQNEVDATYFGRLVKLPSLNPWQVKHVQKQPMQFQDGHDTLVLTDSSENWATADQQGTAQADGTVDTQTQTHGTRDDHGVTRTTTLDERALRRTVSDARAETNGHSASTANAHGSSRTSTQSQSQTNSRGGGRTFRQTLVPRTVVRKIATSVQFFTNDEQFYQAASAIAGFPIGTGLLYIAGRGAIQIAFPLPKKPFRMSPKFAQKKLRELRNLIYARPEYASANKVQSERLRFIQSLARRLQALAAAQEPHLRALPAPADAVPPVPPPQISRSAGLDAPASSPLAI